MGSVATWHVEFSWTRNQTWVPCIGRGDSKPLNPQGSSKLRDFKCLNCPGFHRQLKEWCSFLPHEHERCCYYLRLKYWKNSYPFPTFVLQLSLFSFPCLGQSPGPAPGRQASLMKRPGAPLPFSSTEGAEADRIRHVAAGLYPQPLVWKPQTSWPAERPHPFPPPLRPLDLPPVWPQKALFCPHLALGCHCSNRGVGAGCPEMSQP